MIDLLTPEEVEEVTHELIVLLAAERRLLEATPVSPQARERRHETLSRLLGEISRLSALLDPAYPVIPLASRKAPA
jgi:hypothetical protein